MTNIPKKFGKIEPDKYIGPRCTSLLEASAQGFGGHLSPEIPNIIKHLGGGVLSMASKNGISNQHALPLFVGLSILKDSSVSTKINIKLQPAGQLVGYVDTETNDYKEVLKRVSLPVMCSEQENKRCPGCLYSLINYSESYVAEPQTDDIDVLSREMIKSFLHKQGLSDKNE
jgi:hypothetical protein